MTFAFRPAKRENVPLLLGLAGGTGSGKTLSALLLARGLSGGRPFYGIDTENGRMLHYADDFDFMHGPLDAPFSPERYAAAILAADAEHPPVIVVDSASHEHAGDGGLLDMHEAEFQRLGNREAVKMTAWIRPKMEHKRFVSQLLQVGAHVILCFRAEEKIEIVKVDGKTQIVPKKTLTGLDGWVLIAEKTLPYELTASFLLTADRPGFPKPIKLQSQHRAFFPLDQQVGEETGRRLAEWAAGGALAESDKGQSGAAETGTPGAADRTDNGETHAVAPDSASVISDAQRKRLRAIQNENGVPDEALKAMVDAIAGVQSSKDIPVGKYDELVVAVEAAGQSGGTDFAARAAEAQQRRAQVAS